MTVKAKQELIATAPLNVIKKRKRATDLNVGFEVAMFMASFEENITNIMQMIKEINRGDHAEHVEEATIARYRDAKETLEHMKVRVELFETIMEVIEYDLLESTRETH
jgi:hypothetical protein